MPISLSQRVDAQCPQCGTPFLIEFWLIIDAGERPDLAARCRDGSIFTATCPNGHPLTFGAPLLYHDRAREQLILAVPPQMDEQQARAIHAQLMPRLQAHLLAPFPAYLERTQVVPQPLLPAFLSDDPQAALAEQLARAMPPLLRALYTFIQADSWDKSEQILQAHPELLSDDADQLLAELIDAAREQNDADAEKMLTEHREYLQRARQAGVSGQPSAVSRQPSAVSGQPSAVSRQPSAVSGQPSSVVSQRSSVSIPTELQPLIQQIARLTCPSEMPRKVELCEQALRLVQREDNPPLWAALQVTLANALQQNPLGSRADNLEEAIRHYDLALQVYTREAFPEQWATTQNNLASAYSDRIRGERAENLEEAIRHYELALQVRTREAFPVEWAGTQNNLANAYLNRIRGERADNLEEAIRHYDLALQVYTREAFPTDWAMTQNNLATAYLNRIRGERADNLEEAIRHYDLALQVYTREAFPREYRQTQRNLGNLYFGERRWRDALGALTAAISVGDELFATAYTETGRRAEIAETSTLYARAAYCLLQLNQPAEALTQAEAGRARLLGEALALVEAETQLPTELRNALAAKRQTLRELEAEMRLPAHTPARRSDRDLADQLRAERAALGALVAQIRRDYPDFMPLALTASQIAALVPQDGALVVPIITSRGSVAFVIPHGVNSVDDSHVVRLNDFTDESLNALLVGTEEQPGWLRAYITHYGTAGWWQDLERLLACLWGGCDGRNRIAPLLAPIHARVQALGVSRVVVMPTGGLQLLPLHAAWRVENGARRYWLDDVEITYAPSAYAWRAAQQRARERTGRTALVAGVSQYTRLNDLRYTRVEVEQIGELFGVAPLLDATATPQAVREGARGAAYVHLSCHGAFAWGKDPLESALYLANDEPLTLKEILGKMDLRAARLVVLSACETGITDTRQSPDEYVGLPAGFLQAGVAGVVSSLWTVDDMSTALLMMRFYENHLQGEQTPATALRAAQRWLRNATHAELAELFATYRDTAPDAPTRMAYATAREQMARHALRAPKDKPYAAPYYWAAFGMYGA
jgi:CHAT domain-containing protein/tetratricopeptide (TPR) repeat protein